MARWVSTIHWKRLLRFRLRTLLLMVAFAGVLFGWWSDRQRFEERIAQRDDLLSVLRSVDSPEFHWQDPVRPESMLLFDSVEKVLEAVHDERMWTSSDGTPLKATFQPEHVGYYAVSQLLPLLKGPDPKVRARAAYVLRCVGPLNTSIAPALLAATHDESPDVRFEALWNLEKIDGTVEGLAAELAGRLNGDRPGELEAMIATIRKQDHRHDLNSHLTPLLVHSDPRTRAIATENVRLGGMSREDAMKLLTMLDDPHANCRLAAAVAVRRLDTIDKPTDRPVSQEEVVTRLVRAFKNELDTKVRRELAQSVERLHRAAGE